MCGIIGYIGKKENATEIIINGLEALDYRGYDSAGIAYVENNNVQIIKKEGRICNLKESLPTSITSTIGIGHTRWATHGKPDEINAHPHRYGKFTIVHNGIIENYKELKKKLEEKNYCFQSETDTEIACAVFNYIYETEKDVLKTLIISQKLLQGSYAFAILCDDDLETIYAMKKCSPLIISDNGEEKFIASDISAIFEHANNYYLLEDGDIAILRKENLTFFNPNQGVFKKEKISLSKNKKKIQKEGFEHFMLKEIYEQPTVIQETIQYYFDGTKESLYKNLPDLQKYTNIHIVACGSAYHAGLIAKNWIEEIPKIPVVCEIASEYRYKNVFYNANTLVIFISQSGETADTLASLRKAKNDHIDTLAIVNVVDSNIAREADFVLYTKAGCEVAVATTKAFTSQLIVFSLLTLKLAITNHTINEENLKLLGEQIKQLPLLAESLLKNTSYKEIANAIYQKETVFYLGRKIDYAIGLEGSLKLKEISYINSVAYPAGELKHGTISLIEKDTPVIVILTDSSIKEKTISNLKETEARGAYAIIISNEPIEKEEGFIKIPKLHPLLQPIIAIIPLQLIAYETAKLRECDIDKPKNLAKSVTVE